MFQDDGVAESGHDRLVTPAGEHADVRQHGLGRAVAAVDHIGGREAGLSGEDVNHRLCRVSLVTVGGSLAVGVLNAAVGEVDGKEVEALEIGNAEGG